MRRILSSVRSKAQHIVLLLLDVDGVLTDGRIILDDRGAETKHFHVRDGQGIALLQDSGIQVGVITSRVSRAVARRAKELKIGLVRQGVRDKRAAYDEIKCRQGLTDRQIAYIGDDVVDLPILRQVGLAVSVADGWPGLRREVDYITMKKGGEGAVRELADLILVAQGKMAEALRRFR